MMLLRLAAMPRISALPRHDGQVFRRRYWCWRMRQF